MSTKKVAETGFSGKFLLAMALIATASFVWMFARLTAHSFARQDATAASQTVGRYFSVDTAEIATIAQGQAPSDDFRETVERGLQANVFFAFRIYDTAGRLKYSASASDGTVYSGRNADSINASALQAAREHQPITETGEFMDETGAPRYLAYTMLPVARDGKTVAVQEIYLEQTSRLHQLRQRITLLTLLAALMAAIAFGVPAMAWRRKSADLAMREREMEQQSLRFKTAVDNLPQGITMFDGERNLVVANSSYGEIFGVPADKLSQARSADDIRQLRLEHGCRAVDDIELDENHELVNGRERTEEVWRLSDGRTVRSNRYPVAGGGWVSLHEDITRQLKYAEELHRARNFLNKVIEHTPVAIIVKDARTLRYELVNRAIENVHGLPPERILGKRAGDFFDADQANKIETNDRDVIAQNQRDAVCTEGVIVTPVRGERIISTKRIVVRNANGEAAWLISMVEDVTERRQADARINFLAHHDPLTSLANRTYFHDRVDAALEPATNTEPVAVALFDLDGFKEINDAFGHAAGDEVLRVVAETLRRHATAQDVVARLGGDEFAVLFHSANTEEKLEPLLSKIIESIRAPIVFEDRTMIVEASAGIAFSSAAVSKREDLVRQADLALYEAKSQGKGVYCTYLPEIMERRLSRKGLEMDMHAAVVGDQFEIHYQPIVDLQTGVIVSMEALVRWRHPERGLIPPLDFIPIAEESGMIVQIGEIVLEKACKAAVQWPREVKVSVNLSPIQFRDRSLALKIARVLMETGLSPDRLELEITEAALLDDSFDNIQLLTELRSTGIRIVMDDFGTGYSSLNYLRNFPFDKIKIDRSYVRDLEEGSNHSRTILNAVLAMAEGLHLSTTAEGVETQAQMDILRKAGCTEMQGYFFSRPVPYKDLEPLFERNSMLHVLKDTIAA